MHSFKADPVVQIIGPNCLKCLYQQLKRDLKVLNQVCERDCHGEYHILSKEGRRKGTTFSVRMVFHSWVRDWTSGQSIPVQINFIEYPLPRGQCIGVVVVICMASKQDYISHIFDIIFKPSFYYFQDLCQLNIKHIQ